MWISDKNKCVIILLKMSQQEKFREIKKGGRGVEEAKFLSSAGSYLVYIAKWYSTK